MTSRFTLRPAAMVLPYVFILPCMFSISQHADPSTVVATSLLAVLGLLLNALTALTELCTLGAETASLRLRPTAARVALAMLSATPAFSLMGASSHFLTLGLYAALLGVFIFSIPVLAAVLLRTRTDFTPLSGVPSCKNPH